MKFATKLFIYIFLAMALAICGIIMVAQMWMSTRHLEEYIRFEKELATLVALKSEDYILRDDRIELYKFYTSIVQVDPYIDYIFAENQADILVHTFKKGVPRGLLKLGAMDDSEGINITTVENNDGDRIYHFRIGIGFPPHSILHFGISHEKMQAEMAPLKNLLYLVGTILLAVVPFGMALFLSRLVSKPILTLRKGIERIGHGELDYRFDLKTGDEIEQLVNDINVMAQKLEKSRNGLEKEIKERLQVQEDLSKQSELLNHILNHIPHNVFWKDRELIYMGCNDSFAKAAGFENCDQVIGKTDFDLPWQKHETDYYRQCDKKVIEESKPMLNMEEAITNINREERTVLTSKVPLNDKSGNTFGVLTISYDITDRKKMEDIVNQSQKMDAIGTLAGGIAHDFNNILGGIIGYTELAMDDISDNHPANGYLKEVFKFGLRAKELVRQILTFSRKSKKDRKPLHLSMIVKEEIKLLRSTLPTTIEIRQDVDDNAGMVSADPTQMQQIVMNLCTNASHAMQENGGILTITLSSKVITHETIKKYHGISPGPYVILQVSDNGSGIDSRIIHRIFEPFFTTKEKEKGTGMGLAVVHGIVKDYSGDIIVESQKGKGTTFTVILPKVFSEPQKKENETVTLPTGSEHILIVDDEKMLLELGEKILASLGYRVTPLNGSIEAFETFRQDPKRFDAVITDQTMPHMTGYSLAKRMLEINPHVKIIICTGYSDTLTPEKAREAGIKALLYKPLRKKEIAGILRDIFDHPEKVHFRNEKEIPSEISSTN